MTLQGVSSATTTTDANGNYSFPNLAPNGNYAVNPAALGFAFNPLSRQYTDLSSDVTNANFTATAGTSRQLEIIGGNATPGQDITVRVDLVAQATKMQPAFLLHLRFRHFD